MKTLYAVSVAVLIFLILIAAWFLRIDVFAAMENDCNDY